MSRKWIAAIAVMAAAGGGAAGATAVLGGGAEVDQRGEATIEVSVGDANAAAAGARASGKTKFSYPTGGVQTIPDSEVVNVDITSCPKKSKVVNGTFQTDAPSFLETSHPLGKRGWRVRLFNHGEATAHTPEEYQAIFGLVCAKAGKKK